MPISGPRPIEMSGKLPRYPEDDVEFVCRHLAPIEPQCIAGLMDRLGIETRSNVSTSNGPSPEYYRIAAAFRRGLSLGRLTKNLGQKSWRVAVKTTQARAS